MYGFDVMPLIKTGVLPLKYCNLQGGVPVKLTVKLAKVPGQIAVVPDKIALTRFIVTMAFELKFDEDAEHKFPSKTEVNAYVVFTAGVTEKTYGDEVILFIVTGEPPFCV